jgi:hypothetical protein
MANFPTSLDTGSSLPTPAAGNNTNSPSHASLHGSENAAIIATETKLGIGATTPAANQLLVGTGAGTSAWQGLTSAQLLAILSDETGSGSAVFATSPTLVTPKVDTINENTPGNGTTIGGVNIKSSAITTASSVPTAALQDSSVTSAKVAVGVVVQVAVTSYTAVATGTTIIPFDDTIPQITEGVEYMTQAITPKSATNILVIEATGMLTAATASIMMIGAIFQDATANALATNSFFFSAIGTPTPLPVFHSMTAGTTSAITFRFRAGTQSAATTTFNGAAGGRFFGATTKSMIKVTEIKA